MTYNPSQQYRDASFGGCEFCVVEARDQFGHRVAIHEYPERDTPWSETLGRSVRIYRLRAAIWGETHVAEARDLIRKIECGATERLIHPIWGEIDAIGIRGSATHNPEGRAGETLLDLQFVEAGEFVFPTVTPFAGRSTSNILVGVANTIFDTIVFPNAGSFNIGLFGFISGLAQTLRGLFNRDVVWNGSTIEIANGLDAAALNPSLYTGETFATLIRQSIEALYADAQSPAQALEALCGLMSYEVDASGPECEYALYVRLFAATYAAQAGIDNGYTNPVDAIAFMECLLFTLERDGEIAAGKCFDEIYSQLETLAAAIAVDYKTIALGLPPIISVRCGNVPSLVAAYNIFGNLDTLDSFEELNGIRDSMFMPADVLYQSQ